MPAKQSTVLPMARIYIQTEVSKEYKDLYQDILGPYKDMSADVRRLLETEYPKLKQFADDERARKQKK